MEPILIIAIVYIILLLVFGVISFVAMMMDKRAAEKGEWRTPEWKLHLLEILGGFLGSFTAQRICRHKIKKISYQIAFWFIVVVHILLIALVSIYHSHINNALTKTF